MPNATSDEARAAVTAALEARRARPALKLQRGAALFRPLDTETSSGLIIGVIAWSAAAAVHFGLDRGVVGWVLAAICAVVGVLGLTKGLAGVPHDIRVTRHHSRRSRVAKRMKKANEQYEAGDERRAMTFAQTIVEGSPIMAATGVLMLFMELAGDDALGEELIHERAPAWPSWLYFLGFREKTQGNSVRARELLEQTLATEHPVWATAAAIEILAQLDESSDHVRIDELTEWVLTKGDPAVARELVHYR
jgi:hypothetical protein